MLIWAHRGASAHRPENSLAAFDLARRLEADGVELDVRLSGDGRAVVIHDPDLRRVAGVPVDIARASLREIKVHEIGGGERVPSLEEALEACGEVLVNVELKVDGIRPTGLEEEVARIIRDMGAGERTLISCFHPAALIRVRFLAPEAGRALLFGSSQQWCLRRGIHARGLGLRAVHPEHNLIEPRTVSRWHGRGLKINTWTVNERERMLQLQALGVDGVITDTPEVARAALRSPAPSSP